MEFKVSELNVTDVAKQLSDIPCTGENIKNLVIGKLNELGYQDVKVTFIGYEEETNNLMYSIYTEGPLFVLKVQSSGSDKPCLDVVYVQAYQKV